MERRKRIVLIGHTISEIWGWQNRRRGYFWLAAKFGRLNLETCYDKKLEEIADCLESKKWQFNCPVHLRVHDAKV